MLEPTTPPPTITTSAVAAMSARDGSSLEQQLQRLERTLPAGGDDLVVAPPAWAVLEARLADVELCAPRVTAAGGLERHRADRIAVRRQPVGVGEEELAPGLVLHHRPPQGAAEPAEHVVGPRRRLPLHGVAAERPRHA